MEDENAADIFVPITCCVLNFNQDRDVSRVNPQDPQPQDEQRCQDDAKGRKDGSPNLHGRVSRKKAGLIQMYQLKSDRRKKWFPTVLMPEDTY